MGTRQRLASSDPRLESRNDRTDQFCVSQDATVRAYPRREDALFVDSLAHAFEVSPPPKIEYYFTDDLIQTLGAAGLEFFPLGSDTVGGRANVINRLVFIGSSTHGEEYRHELAHVVLEIFLGSFNTAGLVREGLMTWTGGSAGLTFNQLMPGLKRYLDDHPELTLESILTDPPARMGTLDVGYGRRLSVCPAEVVALDGADQELIATMLSTISIRPGGRPA